MTVLPLIEKLLDDQEQRHAWLFDAGEQIRAWREEDRRRGEVWEIDREDADNER